MPELEAIAGELASRLKARGATLAIAESSAGGLISAALLAVPGASAFFLGGAVVYTRQSRRVLLDIPDAALDGMRPATEPYALLLARTVRARFGAVWGLAETGATGPTGNRCSNGGRRRVSRAGSWRGGRGGDRRSACRAHPPAHLR